MNILQLIPSYLGLLPSRIIELRDHNRALQGQVNSCKLDLQNHPLFSSFHRNQYSKASVNLTPGLPSKTPQLQQCSVQRLAAVCKWTVSTVCGERPSGGVLFNGSTKHDTADAGNEQSLPYGIEEGETCNGCFEIRM